MKAKLHVAARVTWPRVFSVFFHARNIVQSRPLGADYPKVKS
jgi:hypothetical protein